MKNPKDYTSGKTTTCINPRTGKKCHSGAARNVRVAQGGGLANIEEKHVAVGIMLGLKQAEPIIQAYKDTLSDMVNLANQAARNLQATRRNPE